MQILLIILPIITSSVTGLVVWYVQQKYTFSSTERTALQLLMKDLFLRKYDKINTPEEHEYIEKIFATYTALGGNGYIKQLYHNINE